MYSVHGGMDFVHNHTSLPIKSDQPCDAGESQLHAGSAHAEQHPSCQKSPRLTDHPGAACHVQTATATVNLIHIVATASISSSSVTVHCHRCPFRSQNACSWQLLAVLVRKWWETRGSVVLCPVPSAHHVGSWSYIKAWR